MDHHFFVLIHEEFYIKQKMCEILKILIKDVQKKRKKLIEKSKICFPQTSVYAETWP